MLSFVLSLIVCVIICVIIYFTLSFHVILCSQECMLSFVWGGGVCYHLCYYLFMLSFDVIICVIIYFLLSFDVIICVLIYFLLSFHVIICSEECFESFEWGGGICYHLCYHFQGGCMLSFVLSVFCYHLMLSFVLSFILCYHL